MGLLMFLNIIFSMEANLYKRDRDDRTIFEFHIERRLRSKYQINEVLFSQRGSVIFTDFSAVRLFVHKLNAKRDPLLHVYPGEVNATGLLEEIFHYILGLYEEKANPNVFKNAVVHLHKTMGEELLQSLLYDMLDKFPPNDIYKGNISIENYLKGTSNDRPNLHVVLEEAIMLFFANFNPANKKLKELFDDRYLENSEEFRLLIDHLEDFFEEQPPFGPDHQDIFSLFKTPILNTPNDISKQLDYLLENGTYFYPITFVSRF